MRGTVKMFGLSPISSLIIPGAALLVSACAGGVSPRASLPTADYIVERTAQAEIDAQAGYFKGLVQVKLADSHSVEALVSHFAQEDLALALVDKISGRPIYLFEVNKALNINSVVSQLKTSEMVEAAAPSQPIQLTAQDPHYPLQWSFKNTGQEAPGALVGRRGADMSFEGVNTSGSDDVVVAIVDTGIDYFHEDLSIVEERDGQQVVVGGNVWMNPDEIPGNGINDDNNQSEVGGLVDDVFGYDFIAYHGDPMDDHGHGTHIAGVIGALRNNFIGIQGMNENVKMMGVRFLGASGGGSDFGAQKSIYYVIDMQKRFPEKKFIMNCSWGASGRSAENGDADDFLLLAFKEADEANILTFAAAGNSSLSTEFSPHYPSNYSTKLATVVSVAATDNNDQLAGFSNYGHKSVQIAAPGVLIHSTLPGNQYAAWSGTSMATPHVAGLAALVWAKNPEFTAVEVKEHILDTADVLPQLTGLVSSGARINVARALKDDFSVGVEPVAEEIARVIRSPMMMDGNLDLVTEVYEKGATSIQVCFEEIKLGGGNHWLQVYGSDFRIRDLVTGTRVNRNLFTGEPVEVCAAPVPGDRAYLRLFIQNYLDMGAGMMQVGGGAGKQGYVTQKLIVTR